MFGPEDGVNCRMPQPVRNGGIRFRWEEVMHTVSRMADLFKQFLLKFASSQLKRLNLTENEGSVVWYYSTGCKGRAEHVFGEPPVDRSVQWLGYDARSRNRIQPLSV